MSRPLAKLGPAPGARRSDTRHQYYRVLGTDALLPLAVRSNGGQQPSRLTGVRRASWRRDPRPRGARLWPREHGLEGPPRAQRSEHAGRTHGAPTTGEHPFIGQRSTPSSKSQSTSSRGSQAATSTPPRAGADAASNNKPIGAPVHEPPQSHSPLVPNKILNDPNFRILDTSETWIKSLQVSLALVSGAQIALEISIALKAAQFATITAAPSAA